MDEVNKNDEDDDEKKEAEEWLNKNDPMLNTLNHEDLPTCCKSCQRNIGEIDNEKISNTIQWRRMNTAFQNDRQNFIFSCIECYEHEVEYWNERWDDYYNDIRDGLFL